jgi:hypothetical protein
MCMEKEMTINQTEFLNDYGDNIKKEIIKEIINLFKKDSIYSGEVIEFEIKQLMSRQNKHKAYKN